MKTSNFLLGILQILIIFHLQAQDTTSLDDKVLTATSLLPTSDITTDIFYNRVPDYFPFHFLDGINMGDSSYLDKERYKLSYGMLSRAHLDSFPGIAIDSLSRRVDSLANENAVHLGAMYFDYNKLRDKALDTTVGWLSWDSTYFHDQSPQDSTLYEQKRFFGLAGMNKLAEGPWVTFYLDSSMMFTNIGYDTTSLEIDYDDGNGWQDLNLNQYVDVNYAVLDTFKQIKVRMRDTLNQWIYAKTPVYVYAVALTANHDFPIEPDGVIRVGTTYTFDSTKACCEMEMENGRLKELCEIRREAPDHIGTNVAMKNGVEIFFWLNDTCQTPCHRKPLIIVEGFDPFEKYDYNLVFNENLLDSIGLINRQYQMPLPLSEYINLEGYDLYFINFGYENNTDSIQNNAQLLKQAINEINIRKANCGSAEKNVVIGASMGGLIGRWALSEMEAAGEDHETELFVSFDSPMKGANIPIGFQAMITDLRNTKIFGYKMGELKPALESAYIALTRPAARQMLYYSRSATTIESSNANTLHQFNEQFVSEFENLDLAIPHLAISNGSILGEDQGFAESHQLLEDTLFLNSAKELSRIILNAQVADPCFDILEHLNEEQMEAVDSFEKYTSIHNGANFYLDVWATPGRTNDNKVYHKEVVSYAFFPIVVIRNENQFYASDLISIDNAPGGTSVFSNIEEGGSAAAFDFTHNDFCFVPAPSALGIDLPSNLHVNLQDVEEVLNNNNTVVREYRGSIIDNGQNQSSTTNQEHVTLDRNSAVWWRYQTESIGIDFDSILTILDRTFHFGAGSINAPDNLDPANLIPRKTDNYINNFVRVAPEGAIWIGTDDTIGYLPNSNAPVNVADSFEVYITDTYCDGTPIFVSIDSAAEMRLGSTVSNQSGIVYLKDYSRLNIFGDGVLDMRSGSSMYIEDGTRLRLYPGGNAYLDDSSRIIVEPGGELKIDSGASAYLDNSSFILIKEGGHLTIPGHAYVELNERSQIILENGSELFIDSMGRTHLYSGSQIVALPISTIRLTDSSKILLDGESSFQIDGNFFTEGDVEIEAPNGFLEFYAENNAIRSIGGHFRMNGSSRNNLLLWFHDFSYGLNVNAYDLELYNGKIMIATQGGNIWTNGLGPNGDYILHNIHFLGQGDISGGGNPYFQYGNDKALSLRNIQKLDVKDCIFENVTTGISIQESTNTDYKVVNTQFSDVFTGVDASFTDYLLVNDCKFINPKVEEQQATAGIAVKGIGTLDLDKTSIHKFRCGIRDDHPLSSSTINLKNCSEIVSCLIGIYADSSLVHMKKSGLFYNGYGIAGYDIELDIASTGIGNDKNVYVLCQPNGFQQSSSTTDETDTIDGPSVVNPPYMGPTELCGWYFSIENTKNTYSGDIQAENNYWSPNNLVYDGNYIIYHLNPGNAQYIIDSPQYVLAQEPKPGDCSAGGGGQEELILEGDYSVNSDIKVYPNPVQHHLRIESDTPLIIKVHDLNGKLIYTSNFNKSPVIPTYGWEKGVYILDAGGQFFKVIKL